MRNQRFHLNSNEVKHGNERGQKFHFNTSDEVKQPSDCSQRFHFNSS